MRGQEQNRGNTQNPPAAGPGRGFVPPARGRTPQQPSQGYQASQPPQGYYAPRPPQQPQGYQPRDPQQPPQGYQAPPQQPRGYQVPRPQQPPQGYQAPPQQSQGYRPGAQGRSVPYAQPRPQKAPKKPVWILPVLALALLITLAAVLGAGSVRTANEKAEVQRQTESIQAKLDPYRDKFCPGIYVNGVSLGGMTPAEAEAAVNSHIQSQHADWKVTLTYGTNHADITAADLNFTVDNVRDVLTEAWQYGHTGDDEQRYNDMLALEQNPYRTSTAKPAAGNTQGIDDLLARIKSSIDIPAQDAYVTLDPGNINSPFVFYDEVYGLNLDTAPIREWIFEKLSTMETGTYEIRPEQLEPAVRKADLQQKYSLRASAWTKIHTSSTEDRNNNIRHAFEFVNGTRLAPGEIFSFNNIVGYRTAERGFFPAQEIVYGNYVEGYGGGVCQAATTLYQAALCADLSIVERRPHSEEVRYAALGTDATVFLEKGSKHNKDFRFKNSTSDDIYIFAVVEKDPTEKKKNRLRVRVDIYGPYMGDIRYELQSTIVETIDPDVETKKDRKHEYTTYPGELYLYSEGRTGYKVEVYRVDQVSGQTIWDHTDTYEAKKTVYYEGV